jgi:hydrogenase maturation protease
MTEPGHPRILIAGVGNVFLRDDGFGVEVARQLAARPLPAHVEVADVGVRGVDLAYRLLDGYAACVLVDACARGGQPGTLYEIDASARHDGDGAAPPPSFDGHRMTPDAVLSLLATLSAGTGTRPPETIVVVGCEPADLDEGLGLTEPVAAAVPRAVRMILRMIGSDLGQAANRDQDPADAAPAQPGPAPLTMGMH